jgi:inosose dehydratase
VQAKGVRMAVHHHMGTVVQSAEDVDRLMENTGPAVGLLLDTGHMTFAGGDPIAVAKRYADRIVHVQQGHPAAGPRPAWLRSLLRRC